MHCLRIIFSYNVISKIAAAGCSLFLIIDTPRGKLSCNSAVIKTDSKIDIKVIGDTAWS